MSSWVAGVGDSASASSSSATAPRRLAARRILVVAFVAAAAAAGVVYPLARWRTARGDVAHCGGDESSAAAAAAATTTAIGRFADDPSLKFVVALFRHGDRAPISTYKTDPFANDFQEEAGELTKKGKQHMYKKGQIFRRLYNGFLSDLYLDNEIIIKTTKVRRTQMSAAMVLAGLYPPRDYQKWSDFETVWQPIPIYHDSPDDTILYALPRMCPALDSFKHKIFSQAIDIFDENITAPLLLYLSEKYGQLITKKDATLLYDTLKCEESANLKLSEWLDPNHLRTIKSIFENKKMSELFNGNPKMQKILIGRLLQEIVLEMELRLNSTKSNNNFRKMHLYSGHDVSVGNLMGFMKTFFESVDFGASVHLHLHFDEQIGYTVKVFYFDRWDDENGRKVSIPKCGENCQLQEFIKLVRDHISGKWEEECQIVEE